MDATTQCLYVKDAIVYCVVYQKELVIYRILNI